MFPYQHRDMARTVKLRKDSMVLFELGYERSEDCLSNCGVGVAQFKLLTLSNANTGVSLLRWQRPDEMEKGRQDAFLF